MTALVYGLLLAAGLVLLVVTAVRVLVGGIEGRSRPARRSGAAGPGSARRILQERYAAGEISDEEYRHRLDVLEEGN